MILIIIAGVCCYVGGAALLFDGDMIGLVWICLGNLHLFVCQTKSESRKAPPNDKLKKLEERIMVLEHGTSEEGRYMAGTWMS